MWQHLAEIRLASHHGMMTRRVRFNSKRRIGRPIDRETRMRLVASIRYGGNPEHKRNPGDFGLTPPACPRPDKALCDTVGVFSRDEALSLLQNGIERGLVSERFVGSYPQNIWSVAPSGIPLEAELENQELGQYHGYPLPEGDPFREVVLAVWRERFA
jgi:hypothetical protein